LTRAADAHASSACRSCAFIITAYTLRSSVSCQGHVLPGAGCARRGPRGLQVALSNQACVSAACGGAVAVDSSSDACRGVFRFPSAWRSLRSLRRLRSLARRGGAAAATPHPLARQVPRVQAPGHSAAASTRAGGQRCAFTSALTPQVRRAHCSAAAHAVSAQLTTRVHRAHESYEAVRHGVVVRRHSRCDGRSRARNL
jgi:hypothetical protein